MTIEFSQKQFEDVKRLNEDLYKSFKEVYCPYLKDMANPDLREINI